MRIPGRRRQARVSVGNAVCVVDRDGRGWVTQHGHADLMPDTIALLAATTFMVHGARVRAQRRLAIPPWLEATRQAAAYPDAFNEMMNSSGVMPIGTGHTPPGVRMCGSFVLLPSGCLTGEWDPVDIFENIALASREFGALVEAAQWCNVGDAVARIARRLDDAAEEIDFVAPRVMNQLPQAMVAYGTDRAAWGRLAADGGRDPGPDDPASA